MALPLNPSAEAMPTFDNFICDGTPNIEVGGSSYYYRGFAEHDESTVNHQTTSLAKLLYWVFDDITDRMAHEYAEKHRDPSVDFRELLFEHQLNLLEKVNHEWKIQKEKEIAEILTNVPYLV